MSISIAPSKARKFARVKAVMRENPVSLSDAATIARRLFAPGRRFVGPCYRRVNTACRTEIHDAFEEVLLKVPARRSFVTSWNTKWKVTRSADEDMVERDEFWEEVLFGGGRGHQRPNRSR